MGERLVNAISKRDAVQSVIKELFRCYGIPFIETVQAEQFKNTDEQLDYYLRPYGIMRRNVKLNEKWYKSSIGIMMGTLKSDGSKVLLIPNATVGYSYLDIVSTKRHIINRNTAQLLEEEAICFYYPLAQQSLKASDLLLYCAKQMNVGDVVTFVVSLLIPVLLGMLTPFFSKTLIGKILPFADLSYWAAILVYMIFYAISSFFISLFREVTRSRIVAKADTTVQAALFGRLLRLPYTFFMPYSTGDLTLRISAVGKLCSTLSDGIISVGLTALFSIVYVFQIFNFAPTLVLPAISITIITVVFSLVIGSLMNRHNGKLRPEETALQGIENSLIFDIQKIRTTGSEKRVYSKWAKQYARKARLDSNPNAILGVNKTIMLAISLLGMLVIYSVALAAGISAVNFYAFITSYGMLSGALGTLTGLVTSLASVKSMLEMVKPILQQETEDTGGKKIMTELKGRIALEHITFRYQSGIANVLDDISLSIRQGEYLAIVGKTGSGKSTLFRLMLGFEKPQTGSVFFDNEDIQNLDIRSVRSKCGVVLQNASLFPGDIYYNIIISKPTATMDEAWEAAEKAAIADDIRELPMGMRTLISEGSGGISGGQRQRLLIARALVSDPSVILFDEATSALDNVTQEQVTRSIEKMGCTRIVIAHRLSTVRNADRIVVLDKGHIVEQGTYEKLMEKHGFFAELVARQQLEEKNKPVERGKTGTAGF